jgi:hypothetical protein
MSSLIDFDDKSIALEAFASFLCAACPLATDTHWYSIRGTCSDNSLLLLAFLSPRDHGLVLHVVRLNGVVSGIVLCVVRLKGVVSGKLTFTLADLAAALSALLFSFC